MHKRSFSRRSGRSGARPSRAWTDVSGAFIFTTASATAAVRLMSFEMPTSMVGLTADPPEDVTILRVVGSMTVTLGTATTGRWSLALLVQDTTWTPGATLSVDNDKRVLWQRQFMPTAVGSWTAEQWSPPDTHFVATGATSLAPTYSPASQLDISPKVKLEAGKSLYLVAYEDVDGSTFSVTSNSMRVLFQRSRRR